MRDDRPTTLECLDDRGRIVFAQEHHDRLSAFADIASAWRSGLYAVVLVRDFNGDVLAARTVVSGRSPKPVR